MAGKDVGNEGANERSTPLREILVKKQVFVDT